MGRKFHRVALGGVRDEATIRGHRITYVGAKEGRIIEAMRKVGTKNPVFLLDEVDKLGSDYKGDPAAALLEVLDPEQNHSFEDHYLSLPFDLSNVLFIATANERDKIPAPLLDRMEVIQLPGYSFHEKVQIASQHLLPKQILLNGLPSDSLSLPEPTLELVATKYTRESGVRQLERMLGAICRFHAAKVATSNADPLSYKANVLPEDVPVVLGPFKYEEESSMRVKRAGVSIGMVWTSVGGELLYVEASKYSGKGKLLLTGQLGEVIKESAQTALSWLRANAFAYKLTSSPQQNLLEELDIHIHFPAGAVKKDGPSAGVTILSAVLSLLTDKKVRSDTAMTGEITLRGLVLPVGGIKEKVLAAHRAGVRRVVLPHRNKKDLVDIPEKVKKEMQFVFVSTAEGLIEAVFPEGEFLLPKNNFLQSAL